LPSWDILLLEDGGHRGGGINGWQGGAVGHTVGTVATGIGGHVGGVGRGVGGGVGEGCGSGQGAVRQGSGVGERGIVGQQTRIGSSGGEQGAKDNGKLQDEMHTKSTLKYTFTRSFIYIKNCSKNLHCLIIVLFRTHSFLFVFRIVNCCIFETLYP